MALVPKAKPQSQKVVTELQEALKKARGGFVSTMAFSFFINLLLFVSPLYMLQVYDRVLTSRSNSTLVVLTLAAVGALIVLGLIEAVRSRILVRTGALIDTELNTRVFSSVFQQAVRRPAAGYTQALRDLDTLREFLTGSGLIVFCDAPWAPLFIALGFVLHPLLGLVSLFGAIVVFALAIVNNLGTRGLLKDAGTVSMHANNYVSSSLRNAEVLEAMGMMSNIQRRWSERHDAVIGLQAKASDRASAVMAASKSFRMGLQVAILGTGAYLAIHSEISPGTMIAASIIMGRALQPVEMAVGQWKGLVAARGAYERLTDLLANNAAGKDTMTLPRPEGRVSLQQVVIVPPGSSVPALRGVTLDIAPGEVLGVIGPSAAGKSTLARALVGVWPPVQGIVRLDGNDLRHWKSEEIGPHLGYLPQDVELFDGSVAENIARFGDIDPDKVIAAARKAGVHDMVQKLPEGYDTKIGVGGQALSGGQRQRIALARAVYNDPVLVVLDEPNASLDADGEAALMVAIDGMRAAGQTVVVITHKPTLLNAVDTVLVLKGGLVEMKGPRADVLSKFARPRAVASQDAPVQITATPGI
ncbi:type I secretion system permease/ATPase [Rhodospirillum rubrum]|uniref:Type I secretion system ATPase, PrtD n=1 Tax=Rhodospirillum rubrum (strain ATCC 11170 / ATH 1.1.1 / DSM 467 / LMG 4362 / NCIMB 8255 / S1) TaxID=269796 RepID=Q2RML0_RHORT|nr:type I secretion system permease/ATPase [Rhodospirillum rubrum]ABC24635.1 Type I secretion system ATPase, PrtD [Rhodospirillum rubrum ATCC 11170]MBK5956365.1 type I secretion system permease/ATPase [Rhodospirillum rubrum]